MSATYADRFADAIAWRLPDDVTVTNAQGMVVIERGTARVVVHLPGGDKRRAVDDADARGALRAAASRLRSEVPKYREEFRAPALALAAILDAAALCQGTGRIVSVLRHRRAIYVDGAWRARCPVCDKSAPFGLAETTKSADGYVRRYLDH